MTPAISIIVPVYNLEFYVERCLVSLEKQTLQNIEILIVDDGSTDDSPEIIAAWPRRDPRFQVHRKANGGHGSACNLGIELAKGEYVMIVDGDDFLDPDTCEWMYAKATEKNADLLIGNLKYFFPQGRLETFRPLEIEDEATLDATWRAKLFDTWATPCARIYRRSMFQDPDVRFLPGIIFADVNFAPKSIWAAKTIHYVNRELYNYDVTRPTQSLRQTNKKILNVIPALDDMLGFFKKKGAFEAWEPQLMLFTLRHVISWIDKARGLSDYPRPRAIAELFAVLDRHFGDRWLALLPKEAGRRKGLLIRQARRLGYQPLAWTWKLNEGAKAVDRALEKGFHLPARGYQKLATWLKDAVVNRVTY